LTLTGRTQRRVERLAAEVARRGDAVKAIARDPAVDDELKRLTAEADAYRREGDPTKLQAVSARLAGLDARLRDEYTVTVVQGAGRKSAVDRYFKESKGGVAYYLIVEAKRPDGSLVTRRIHNDETGKDKDVTTWAERVPKEVYDRLAKDKREDGVLNETTFAVKKRGEAVEVVTMPGADGQPLRRLGQITEW
jgi:hypothetical protein